MSYFPYHLCEDSRKALSHRLLGHAPHSPQPIPPSATAKSTMLRQLFVLVACATPSSPRSLLPATASAQATATAAATATTTTTAAATTTTTTTTTSTSTSTLSFWPLQCSPKTLNSLIPKPLHPPATGLLLKNLNNVGETL